MRRPRNAHIFARNFSPKCIKYLTFYTNTDIGPDEQKDQRTNLQTWMDGQTTRRTDGRTDGQAKFWNVPFVISALMQRQAADGFHRFHQNSIRLTFGPCKINQFEISVDRRRSRTKWATNECQTRYKK